MPRPLKTEFPGAWYHVTSRADDAAVSVALRGFEMRLKSHQRLR